VVAIVLEIIVVWVAMVATGIKLSWTTQQLLSATLLTSPPFISKQKEF
jgi:hypothetical protein